MPEPRPWWKRAILWEMPFVAALGAFMLWVRLLPAKALVYGDRAYYIGTDPFFHYRETLGIVRAFPRIPRWDPWTFYPNGTATNQFGTLFDWAAAAWVVMTQGKDASELYVQQVLGVYPAILGALLIVPFFFLAKRLVGVWGAVIASITLALLPGEFLIRSIAGYSDHHVAEALMMLVSILGVYVACERGHEARDALRDWRAWRGYWRAIVFGVLGGVALGVSFYTWPPAALFFLGILFVWLNIVVLVENARGNDTRGLAFGACVSFAVAGLMMIPVMETTDIADFNAYGLLQVVAPLAAAGWIIGLAWLSHWLRERGVEWYVVPASLVVLALAGVFAIFTFAQRFFGSIAWGLSWVTGIGVRRTTMTIAEARESAFLCSRDTGDYSCLQTDFGLVAPVSLMLLFALAAWTVYKRRHADILLLVWSVVVFLATNTQIRFSYYLALNMALLVGWLAARIAEATGLGREEREVVVQTVKGKGRKTRRIEADEARGLPLRVGAVAAVLLIVLPGNVFATETSRPGWVGANIRQPDGDLQLWLQGLDWMRENTPDAGVDLSLVVPRPAAGERYDYPDETYGVLSWWDYGHWIETTALRPPVANPFQQAAPFASLWFTERDPAQADRMLDAWVGDAGPVRYVWIDDEMATGKYGAITVWAHSQNLSRAQWAGGQYLERRALGLAGRDVEAYHIGPEYRESMMGRLYDADAQGLGTYRLVYEHPDYAAVGNVVGADGGARCVHDRIPSGACPYGIDAADVDAWRANPGTAVELGQDAYGYELQVVSRLKLFERVEGAKLSGTAAPGEVVRAELALALQHANGNSRSWRHVVETRAGPDGAFVLEWPYPTTGLLAPEEGGTRSIVVPQGAVRVSTGARSAMVDVDERSVLEGLRLDAPLS